MGQSHAGFHGWSSCPQTLPACPQSLTTMLCLAGVQTKKVLDLTAKLSKEAEELRIEVGRGRVHHHNAMLCPLQVRVMVGVLATAIR